MSFNNSIMCATCKGSKLLCGAKKCVLLDRAYSIIKSRKNLNKIKEKSTIFEKTFPEFFATSKNYPSILSGPVLSLNQEKMYENESKLYGLTYEEIIDYRFNTLSCFYETDPFNRNKIDEIKDAYLSTNPVDLEAKIKNSFHNPITSKFFSPIGSSTSLLNAKICDNPKIPKKVDSIINENLKAEKALIELVEKGYDNYYLTRIFSTGFLGKKENKKIVPTKWSITAVDDILSKKLKEKIKNYPLISDILVYSTEFLFNHFEIILLPRPFSFELFECWMPKALWSNSVDISIVHDFEGFFPRTTYAKQLGGYYATRFGVCKFLEKIKRQATAIVIREILPGYIIPVGVWEVRENTLHAFDKKPRKFFNIKDALDSVKLRINTDVNKIKKMSKIINQKTLLEY